jgi:hypothetical protein
MESNRWNIEELSNSAQELLELKLDAFQWCSIEMNESADMRELNFQVSFAESTWCQGTLQWQIYRAKKRKSIVV